jgi:23S rRNA (guanosine2251-2'-O)-methyltransferase
MKEPYFGEQLLQLPERRPIHVVLDNVRSAFNVGSIFRTADAAGLACVHLCGITCWPPHPKLEKTSLGAHQYVPWRRYAQTSEALDYLESEGIPVWSLETCENAICLSEFEWPERCAVVFGHEVVGVDEAILRRCQGTLRIPMQGVKNSLNVASAFAIVAYAGLSGKSLALKAGSSS